MQEVQIIPRMVSVYINEVGRRDRPLSEAQVFIYGKRGYIYSAIGRDFLKNHDSIAKGLKKYGLETLEGPMIPKVAEAVQKIIGGRIAIGAEEDYGNGVKMNYVTVTL